MCFKLSFSMKIMILHRTTGLALRSIAGASNLGSRSFSKDYSSDDEKDKKKEKHIENESKNASKDEMPKSDEQDETAAAKLNRLLASMQTDDPYTLSKQANNMARPGTMSKKRRETLKEEIANKDVYQAVKRVASLLGDQHQQKQTESELLAKLLGNNDSEDDKASKKESRKNKTPESEMSLSELIVGMKIDRKPQQQQQTTRSDYVRRSLAAARFQQSGDGNAKYQQKRVQRTKREAETFTGSVNLYGSERLNIFKELSDLKDSPDILNTWAHLQQRDLQLQVAHPPSNYFEKIALWTEQGKVWRFPINNEQDWQVEDPNVDFSEHIFLDQHLESWCPSKGPIRHFMELVCVGLSKNPYVTAKEKKDHILWYRDYFESKRDILKEYMQKSTPKQLNENQAAEAK